MTKNDKLNRLERAAAKNEQAADDARWKQAAEIVRRLDNETEREIAATWFNGRTEKPYKQQHVSRFAAVHQMFYSVPSKDRPPFWTAVDQAQGTTTRTERSESQPPMSEATAIKLIENIDEKTPPEIQKVVLAAVMKADFAQSIRKVIKAREARPEKSAYDALADATAKSVDVGFALWMAHDRLIDAEPPPEEETVRLLALCDSVAEGAKRNVRFAEALRGLLETGEFEDEVRELLDEARPA